MTAFNDLPKIPKRVWHRSAWSRSNLESAKVEARFLQESGETVKIVKEVRWRVFWKRRKS